MMEKVRLGEIVSFKTGKLDSNAAKPSGEYPFFTCSQETFKTDTYAFDTEAVLLGGNNANGIYPLKYYSGKFNAYQRTYVIRSLDKSRLINRYLFYALYPKLDLLRTISTGVATKFLTLRILEHIDIELPLLLTQQKIAAILSAYDDLIENNLKRIKILEEMAQMIYREWFVNFRFPEHEKVKMVKSELRMIPKGWQVKKMSEVADVIDCLHSKKPKAIEEGTKILLQLFNIGDSGKMDMSKKFSISEEDYALWTRRIEASEGDCVITNVGRIAAVGQIPQGIKAALGRNMTAVRAKPEHMTPSFLIQYLLSPHMQNEVLMKKDSGTIMDSLNVKGIVRLSIVIPLKEVMTLFDNIVKPLRRRLELLAEQNNNLRKTRYLLLPKLINGEIDVENINKLETIREDL